MLGETNDVQVEAKPDRRAARREATKAEIVDAAWELVREQGLAALSLRDLAAKVGMRAPSLYQYFDSKNAIYDALFKQGAEAALATRTSLDPEGDTRTVLREAAFSFFEFATSDPARAQLLFQRTIPGFEPSPESYAPAVAMLEILHDAFARLGITDPDAPDTWTALLSGLVNQQLANDPGGNRWARLIDRSVDMFIAEFVGTTKKGK
jgi:AcrR family transcriptional regulator